MAKETPAAAAPEMPSKGKLLRSFLPLIVIFGLRQLSIPEEEMTKLSLYVFYGRVAISVILAVVMFWKATKSSQTVKVPAHEKSTGTQQTELVPEMSQKEYDMKETKSWIGQTAFQAGLIYFLFFKWNFVQPLLLSSIVAVPQFIFDTPVIQALVFGKGLARPFKAEDKGGLFSMIGGQEEVKVVEEEKKKGNDKKKD